MTTRPGVNVCHPKNTHIPFADLNNVAVADQLSLFLKKQGLDGMTAGR